MLRVPHNIKWYSRSTSLCYVGNFSYVFIVTWRMNDYSNPYANNGHIMNIHMDIVNIHVFDNIL